MHFRQEFKFRLGDRAIYKDPTSGETEEVTIRQRTLRIDKDGQKVSYVCREGNHKHVSYWDEMAEENLSFAGEEHGKDVVAGDIMDGLGEHLEIGDTVFYDVYYCANGIRVEDRVPNVDFTFAKELEIDHFKIDWYIEVGFKDGKVVDDVDKVYYDKQVHGKMTFEDLTVGEKRYGMPKGFPLQERAWNTHKSIGENFAQEYVAALSRPGYALIGKDAAKKAWKERNEGEHDFYIIKRWLTHLGKFDEVAKLIETGVKPVVKKPRVVTPRKKKDEDSLDDIMAKLKADPSLLAKVKKML
jgi:hypothetical protein